MGDVLDRQKNYTEFSKKGPSLARRYTIPQRLTIYPCRNVPLTGLHTNQSVLCSEDKFRWGWTGEGQLGRKQMPVGTLRLLPHNWERVKAKLLLCFVSQIDNFQTAASEAYVIAASVILALQLCELW